MSKLMSILSIIIGMSLISCNNDSEVAANLAEREAKQLLETSAQEGGREMYTPGNGVNFKVEDSVYVKSALAINIAKTNANVTLPLFKGIAPNGHSVYYIITEASDFNVAKQMGVNFSPKLVHAIDTGGDQKVTIKDGHMVFKGSVDFSPTRSVEAGDAPDYFPPKQIATGALADAEWSSIVVLPSGLVLNAQLVSGDGGNHDRLLAIDIPKMTVTLSILDGFRGGKEYFFHLVTDASAEIASVLEQGVLATRLDKIPAYGSSLPSDKSALLGFSPNANGITDILDPQAQGFSYSLRNNGVDPINVFPIAPYNDNNSTQNNYSPLWDAHVSVWTDKAFAEGKVRRITSIKDQKALIADGYLTSAATDGAVNEYTGLKPLRIIINCPVIAHPNIVN
ncbi:hypothetical protein J3D55_004473 [Chryseobacterium ginsenosidimutans]|uniref:DUF7482 domain-containing protein n=1 Tax=Chryseobacterium ginsenosidimutans TaxID=687846 RepID=UPI002167BCAE|nr:hypothetical protein [Chryseobacterium ginsenosidimutans]MCS3871557.1 hypothetical protein [Chryseobacterium ginsenosidimutans]